MVISVAEMKATYAAQTMSPGTGGNGGRMSNVGVTDSLIGQQIADITLADREAGVSRYYKFFRKVPNALNKALNDVRLWQGFRALGDVKLLMAAGTFTDTETDLTSPNLYGCANLDVAVTAGATTITVNTPGSAYAIFRAGDIVSINSLSDESDTGGTLEFATIAAGGVSAYTGDQVILTLEAGLRYDYAASRVVGASTILTRVASCISQSLLQGSASSLTKVSTVGTFDNAATPIVVSSIGGITQTWTFTFTSATAFDITGDTLGAIGSGNISSQVLPTNPDFSVDYFTMPANFFTGTWVSGDTFTFRSDPCALPVWYYLDVPAGSNPIEVETFAAWFTGYEGS